MKGKSTLTVLAGAAVALAVAVPFAPSASASVEGRPRLVFQNTNPGGANAIQVYSVARDGSLSVGPLVPTGGQGNGASLGDQGGVVRYGGLVLAVNAGDDSVSTFSITAQGLRLNDVEPSGGSRPVSIAVHGDEAFVLNAGSDSISGFRLTGRGELRPIAGSTRSLTGTGVGGAEIKFDAEGHALIVSEKATNTLVTFRLDRRGLPDAGTPTASVGAVPFGFDIDRNNHVIVSEAGPGALSSYRLNRSGLSVVTAGLADTQKAACWVEVTNDGRFAFTTNAASATISSYAIGRDGSLELREAVAATTDAGPTDLAESGDGRFLFVRVRSGAVQSFAIGAHGSLTLVGTAAGAPATGTSGLAAS